MRFHAGLFYTSYTEFVLVVGQGYDHPGNLLAVQFLAEWHCSVWCQKGTHELTEKRVMEAVNVTYSCRGL